MKSIFLPETTSDCINRIDKLTPDSQPLWGKMDVAQMFAHLNLPYDIAYNKRVTKPSFFMKLLAKLFIKKMVTSDKPYKKNSPTAKDFVVADQRNFEVEKQKLIANIQETEKKGKAYFEGKVNPTFGKMTAQEWNNLFYKHIDHHFQQFGV
jgi:hypothetical protein